MQHYQHLCQSDRWRSLPEGVKPLRLVWACTDIPPEFTWCYLQMLVAPETVTMLSPSMLETHREVSLLPTSLTGEERVKQILTSGLQMKTSLNKQADQLVNEGMTRSSNAFNQLLEAIEQKRGL